MNRFISWGVIPIGAIIGGGLGSAIGNRSALWVSVAALAVLTPVPIALSPVRRACNLHVAPGQSPGTAVPTGGDEAGGAPTEPDERLKEALRADAPFRHLNSTAAAEEK